MVTFLQETLAHLAKTYSTFADITFILPSKRAGGFLMHELKNTVTKTQFAPTIYSIEEFIEHLSGLSIIDHTELLFKSYEAYLKTDSIPEKDNFETYASWAPALLNDFNEMDRYLIEPKPFFGYLADIKTLERWGVREQPTSLIDNYLQFWNSLPLFYENLQAQLLAENIGYQGMVYREAAANLEHYCNSTKGKPHVFVGFNALNTSEQHIIQAMLETGNTQIYWDTDSHFYNDPGHGASYFIRKYTQEWKYFQERQPNFIGNTFEKAKQIQLVEAQRDMAQAKYVGELLSKLSEEELSKTAIVLGDENLLVPLLYSLPENVRQLNVTMGVSIANFPATVFFELLLALQAKDSPTLYYKEVLSILNHPLCRKLLPHSERIAQNLVRENITHTTFEKLTQLGQAGDKIPLTLLFEPWGNNVSKATQAALAIARALLGKYQVGTVEEAVLLRLNAVLGELEALNQKYGYLNSIKSMQLLFSELVAGTTLDFEGDAYEGLQLMGVLETRVLDFENVIITSVNEGLLPSGKSNASFITYDLKQQFKLPLYTEKDAVYTYHFYRLLHRAKNVTLLYNNFSEGINSGEKSRFIRQLEVDCLPNHHLNKVILSPQVPIASTRLQQINKTEAVIHRVKEMAAYGFSPSALTSYIRNPLEFYFQRILGLKEMEEIEETVAANTLGTIIHDTLEKFYKPLEGSLLTVESLRQMKENIPHQVTAQFHKSFKGGTFDRGMNLIIFEVAKRYISNFLDMEIADIDAGNTIRIIKIESKLEVEIPIPELDFPVRLQGKVDRVDEYNGQMRIIDYKTGKVAQADVEIVEWDVLHRDYQYSKAFQVLAYTLMINKEIAVNQAEAGIISFKNLGAGFLKFGVKDKPGSRNKQQLITAEILDNFTEELKKLILEICDPAIPFTEKEIEQ